MNSCGSCASYPSLSRTQRTGPSALVMPARGCSPGRLFSAAPAAAQGHGLVEGDQDEKVREQRRLVFVLRLHDPGLAVAGDLEILHRRVVHALDIEVLLDGHQELLAAARTVGLVLR